MNRRIQILAGSAWLLGIGCGMCYLMSYSYTKGNETGVVPGSWPAKSAIPTEAGQPNLVMFIHPKCPCTRASLDELAELLARDKDLVRAWVVIVKPPGAGANWAQTGLREQALSIPGVSVTIDEDGREASLFRVATSGVTVLYDRGGHLLFKGGITPSRGHEGDNGGLLGIDDLLHGRKAAFNTTPVYGCALADADPKGAPVSCKP